MSNPAYSRRKGARFEQRTAERLAQLTGQPVERRHLSGAHDRGDLSGLTIRGGRLVVECKNVTGLDGISDHLRQAERERANDKALACMVVRKRPRVGFETDEGMDAQLVVLTLADMARILNAANGAE